MDYTFKLKDFEATNKQHNSRIKKVRQAIDFDTLMGSNWIEEVEYYLKTGGLGVGSYWHTFSVQKEDGNLYNFRESKSKLRMVKTVINNATRAFITNSLKFHELPESWDTAFYLAYYSKINMGMKRLAKYYV